MLKAWKRRFKMYEDCYKRGVLSRKFIEKIVSVDGLDVYRNWDKYCNDKYGKIEQRGS